MTGKQPVHFQNLAAYVRMLAVKLPYHPSKKRVWDAFKAVSGLSQEKAIRALTWGKRPILRIKKLPGDKNGMFRRSTPNLIYLDRQLASVFEVNPTNPKMREVVEGVLLHEIVHWANDKQKVPHKHGQYGSIDFEMGDWFEQLGYGRDISYWARGPIIPLFDEIRIKPAAPAATPRAPAKGDSDDQPLRVHLDLRELVEYDKPYPVTDRYGALGVRRGSETMARDPGRPKRVLAKVRQKFQALSNEVDIELGLGSGADRCIKARYIHGLNSRMMGRAAHAVGRMESDPDEPYTPEPGDPQVSGYVYEGAILAEIETLLLPDSPSIGIDNIVATVLAHELGHNLGLEHAPSPFDIMYVYQSEDPDNQPNQQQKKWLSLAEQNKLGFSPIQVRKIQLTLAK